MDTRAYSRPHCESKGPDAETETSRDRETGDEQEEATSCCCPLHAWDCPIVSGFDGAIGSTLTRPIRSKTHTTKHTGKGTVWCCSEEGSQPLAFGVFKSLRTTRFAAVASK